MKARQEVEVLFTKYTAAGNDFVAIDDWSRKHNLAKEQIIKLCDRRFGIGADGVLILRASETDDFQMNYYNADGSRGEMCGNGARAIVHFAHLNQHAGRSGTFHADDGPHQFVIEPTGIRVEIKVPGNLASWNLPKAGCGCINTGVPHLVVPEADVFAVDLDSLGRDMNAHPEHPEGTNLNLIGKGEKGRVLIRTWERGVNQETLACGTGATAAAIFVNQEWGYNWPIQLVSQGGALQVNRIRNQYWLGGPVELVFNGRMSLDA